MSVTNNLQNDYDEYLNPAPAFKDPIPDFPSERKSDDLLCWLVQKDKKPFNPRTGRITNDCKLGVNFREAVNYCDKHKEEGFGLGHYLRKEDGLNVIDLDHCVPVGGGTVATWAADIIRALGSAVYWELSPSKEGLHGWFRGVKPGDQCRRGIEWYDHDRYLTVSGDKIFPELPSVIGTVDSDVLQTVYDKMLRGDFVEPEKTPANTTPTPAPKASAEPRNKLIHHHGGLTNELTLLMTGDFVEGATPFTVADQDEHNTMSFGSQSEAIASLLYHLAGKHNCDPEKINDEFLTSTLYQGITKWNANGGKWERLGKGEIAGAIKKYEATRPSTTPAAQSQAPASAITVADDDEEIIEADEKLPPFPQFTGLLHDLCDALQPDIPYAYKLTSALTCAGIMRSGLDTLRDEPHIQPRFFATLVGQPGNGKTAAMNEVTKAMKAVSANYKQFSEIGSGPALVDAFYDINKQALMSTNVGESFLESPSRILIASDEFKSIFDKTKSDSGGKFSMLGELLKLYESNVTGSNVRGQKNKINLNNAHLAVLGGATEEGYASMWIGTSGASGGLQSRIIPVGLEPFRMPSRKQQPDADKLATVTLKLVEYAKSEAHSFDLTDAAWEMFADWWDKKDQKKDPSVVRLDGIAKKVLILLAGTNEQTVIDESLVSQAIQFADYVHFCRSRYNPADSLTLTQAMENLIVRAYEKHGDMTQNQCRQRTNADKKPGGMGPFLAAFKNLFMGQKLRVVSKTHKGEVFHVCK